MHRKTVNQSTEKQADLESRPQIPRTRPMTWPPGPRTWHSRPRPRLDIHGQHQGLTCFQGHPQPQFHLLPINKTASF